VKEETEGSMFISGKKKNTWESTNIVTVLI